MPSLTQLEYAVAVDTHRHFGKAAKACHVSQPTLSTQLAKLEDELGCVLFDREKQPVIPTPDGERLLAQARVVVAELRRFEKLAKEGEDDVAGSFRLGVIPTVSPYLVPLFLGAFRERYPKLDLSLEEMQTDTLLAALERESLDAGLLATPLESSAFDVRVLYDEPFYLYVPTHHPLAQKPYVKERDIPADELWLLSDGHCLRGQVLQLCRVRPNKKDKGGTRTGHPTLPASFESGNLETLARLVDGGIGITLLPYLSVMPHHLAGEKPGSTKSGERTRRGGMAIPFEHPVPAREISLVTYRRHATRRVCDALAEVIVECLPAALRPHQGNGGRGGRKARDVRIVPLG